MNLYFRSTQKVEVQAEAVFVNNTSYTFRVRLSGAYPEKAAHTIIGRTTHELKKLILSYDGVSYQVPITMNPTDSNGIAVIDIYGNRDKWSELLRMEALKVETDG